MDAFDTDKTSFQTPMSNFYSTGMPFGLKKAGATYQHATVAIFNDMLHVLRTMLMVLLYGPKKLVINKLII